MRAKTEFVQEQGRLYMDLKSIFPLVGRQKPLNPEPPGDDCQLQTNFGISVNNPYCFILLHLRNKNNKNPMHINLPIVCIFHDRIPYDIVYSSKGYIRGLKSPQHPKVKLKEMNKIFKQACTHQDLPKNEQAVAAFLEKQMLMLSDNDVFLVSCKMKQDSFFKKLQYIRNKIPSNDNNPIIVHYSDEVQDDIILKLATQSLLSYKTEEQIFNKLMEQQKGQLKYLRFLNEKMVLFLNYEHNIRVRRCDFVYVKTIEGSYFFVNATNLIFHNLTNAILQRQKRLAQKQEQRSKILIMSPQKQARYRSFENKHQKTYQNVMHDQFKSIVSKMNFQMISDNKREQVKNEIAFKKLHPKSRFTYTQVISSSNFTRVKDQVLENSRRKPITIPSRYVMRFYNKVRDNRVKTQVIDVLDF